MDLRERPAGSFVRHPWETVRARFFVREASRAAGGAAPRRILDVGSGDTWLAAELAARCPDTTIVCWDASYTPQQLAELGAKLPERVSLRSEPPAPDERFDLLLLLDVLEHVERDRDFLVSVVRRYLEPGGRVLVSVPAWPCLFGAQDRTLGHVRRYTRRSCRALLEGADLAPVRSGGLFYSLVPLRWLSVWMGRARGETGPRPDFRLEWPHGARSARWVGRLLELDAALARAATRLRLDCPGLSCWALCEKWR